MSTLLTRDAFREAVFARDNNQCVFCDQPAADAHHIMERRLWPDGGYYIENGASVCEMHHIWCEQTLLSVEEVREAAGITEVVLPPHLYRDVTYDKWANILDGNTRYPGELFEDESVRKILDSAGLLPFFTHRYKYPRTFHLPWSPGVTRDDRVMSSIEALTDGGRVIVTEKMDGENTTLYRDYMHARSVTFDNHPSRSWVKGLWSRIAYDIPDGMRICGENLYAKHSIAYEDLSSYFLVFSIWERTKCLSWDDTLEFAELLGLHTVPVITDGEFLCEDTPLPPSGEGYVARVARSFQMRDFSRMAGKYVRKGHVITTHNWKAQQVVPNGLRES